MNTPGSTAAQVALLLWIPLSVLFMSLARSPQQGFLWIVLGGVMFLPERVALAIPLIPPLTKHLLCSTLAWIGIVLLKGKELRGAPRVAAGTLLVPIVLLSSIGTWLTNGDTMIYGQRVQPGQTYKEMFLGFEVSLFQMILPYYLGAKLFRTKEDLTLLLKGLCYATLIYVPFVLLEVRLAPFLHTKVYGYFQHSFTQARRGDGFRAFVFMAHGLSVSYFLAQGIIATVTLAKLKVRGLILSAGKAGFILSAALAASAGTAAVSYAALNSLAIWFTKARTQVRIARWLSVLVLLYPMARLYEYFPTEWLLEKITETMGVEKAGSLGFRFRNEDILLEKALSRRWFGWGWSGRHLVYDINGKAISVTDGEWIIHMGQGGIVKFLIVFSVLLIPIWHVSRTWPNIKDDETQRILAVFCLLLAVQAVDMLPNASWNSLGYVLAGATISTSAQLRSLRKGTT